MMPLRALTLVVLLSACSPAPLPVSTTAPTTAPTAITAIASAEAPSPKAARSPTPCGALDCMAYDTAAEAFAAVLAHQPRVIAIGEAHAQRGSEEVESTTKRFTDQLLPQLKGKASDLVLELMVGAKECKPTEQVEQNVHKPVTKNQAAGNQNEFVTLGHRSKGMGIQPHVLRPTCEAYGEIASAGPDGIVATLSLIAKLTDELVRRILARNAKTDVDKIVVAYGGAMHNDLTPRAGREAWSFGPALRETVDGRYIELDIFVPELIGDSDSWKAFGWYAHYDRAKHGAKVTLFRMGEHSFVMVFAASE